VHLLVYVDANCLTLSVPFIVLIRGFDFSDGFLTDTQISAARMNGEVQLKELEHWEPDNYDENEMHDLGSGTLLVNTYRCG